MESKVTALYIHGARGRMGRVLHSLVEEDRSFSVCENIDTADVVIDFSAAETVEALLSRCIAHQKPVVIGTTGNFDSSLLSLAAKKIPILFSPNFSFGMTLFMEVVRSLSLKLGEFCQTKIIESHHIHKKDQPSGTALALQKALHGQKAEINSIRSGNTIGDHTVLFSLGDEEIELSHRIQSRKVFGKGALLAAKFLKNQREGLYSMDEVFSNVAH